MGSLRKQANKNKVNNAMLDKMKEIAKNAALLEVDKQAEDIANRTQNKLVYSMFQAGLSVKTVKKVIKIMDEAVTPWYEDYADYGVADAALIQRLKEYGFEPKSIENEV